MIYNTIIIVSWDEACLPDLRVKGQVACKLRRGGVCLPLLGLLRRGVVCRVRDLGLRLVTWLEDESPVLASMLVTE